MFCDLWSNYSVILENMMKSLKEVLVVIFTLFFQNLDLSCIPIKILLLNCLSNQFVIFILVICDFIMDENEKWKTLAILLSKKMCELISDFHLCDFIMDDNEKWKTAILVSKRNVWTNKVSQDSVNTLNCILNIYIVCWRGKIKIF